MENIANIDSIVNAMKANDGEFFFVPWIGRNYEKGIKNGQKVLVIGASHYCNHSNECVCSFENKNCKKLTSMGCENGCEYFSKCTSGHTKEFNNTCPWMSADEYTSNFSDLCSAIEKRIYPDKHKLTDKLESTTLGEVCNFLAEEKNRTFKKFTEYFVEFFKIDAKDVWKNIAFANYAQNFQPKSTGNTFQETDFNAFLKYKEILSPDVVIIWGDVGNELFRREFKKNTEFDEYIWKEKNATFLHTYHPSFGGYRHGGKLEIAMKMVFK